MALFPSFSTPEDPTVALLKDEMSQLTVKILDKTSKAGAARSVLNELERELVELQMKHASIKNSVAVIEAHLANSKLKAEQSGSLAI